MSSGSVTESIGTHSFNSFPSVKADKLIKKHRKKSKRRKRSDPLVTDISNLLSTSLSLVSPDANAIKNQNKLSCSQSESLADHEQLDNEQICTNSTLVAEIIDLDDKSVTSESPSTQIIISELETPSVIDTRTKSKNVFEFMMDSRNKVIGRNSPGKEVDKETSVVASENKGKLFARKLLFEKWATAKGCKKRKLEEKEREIYVKHHLHKRAKKLKSMLLIEEKQTPKKSETFCSDSENSQDVSINQIQTDDKKILNVDATLTSSAKIVDDITENKSTKSRHKNSLQNFLGISKPEKRKFIEDDDFESDGNDNSNRENLIKVKMFSPAIFKRTKKATKNHGAIFSGNLTSDNKLTKKNHSIDIKDKHQSKAKESANWPIKHSESLTSNRKCKKRQMKSSLDIIEIEEKMIDTNVYIVGTASEDKQNLAEAGKAEELANWPIKNSESLKSNRKCKKKQIKSSLDVIKIEEKVIDTNVYIVETASEDNQNLADAGKNIKTTTYDKMHTKLSKAKQNKIIKKKDIHCKTVSGYSSVKHKSPKHVNKNTSSKICDVDENSSDGSVCLIKSPLETNENESLRRSFRNRKKTSYVDTIDVYLVNSDDTENDECQKNGNKEDKVMKIAPVFLQKKIKQQVDPLVLEARRKFLMSGIPETLKKIKEKQQGLDDIETQFFPDISHIQQKCTTVDSTDYWNLPEVDLPTVDLNVRLPQIQLLGKGVLNKFEDKDVLSKYKDNRSDSPCLPEKIKSLKLILLQIKKKNPDYPVFRSFRLLKEKFDRAKLKKTDAKRSVSTKKKKKWKNKTDLKSEINNQQENYHDSSMMWTEKYKANTCEDLIGNYNCTSQLKKWLQGWLDISESRSRILKRRYSSGSEFDYDNESRDSTSCPRNAIVLTGPHGSGKTMTVYALCNELGINVLELNASSKRTGKRLLQEMQEATQSHQVRKNDTLDLDSFFKSTNSQVHKTSKETNESSTKTPKMCLLLVEDVDVVFEQDEGFLSALNQLLASSKRPIILTASDISSPNLQRFIEQNSVIQFSSLKPKIMALWMQILCLLEGCFISSESLSELLQWNKGDMRKTLLQLQFWVESGGGNYTDTPLNIIVKLNTSCEEILLNDDTHLPIEETQENDSITVPVHSNCVSSFLDKNDISLDKIWWNLPHHFNVKQDLSHFKSNINIEESRSASEMKDLQKCCDYFECISEIDRYNLKSGCNMEDNLLMSKNGLTELKDSSELTEVYSNFNPRTDFVREWSNSLLQMNLHADSVIDMGLPNSEERRRQNKQRACRENYREVVPLSYHVDRRAFSLDFYPCLRTIARSEMKRSANNQKRRNRFFNYFRTLGFTCSETVLKTACNVLDSNFNDCEKR